MMIFVKGLTVRTIALETDLLQNLAGLRAAIQAKEVVPSQYWRLVYAGKQLAENKSLQEYGIQSNATVHLVGQLLGGKGGFGSLLRGAGRAILTDNVDACRDLSGRRLRQANAEKRLAEWAAEAKERELEKVALKHLKEQQKATQREERAQVDSDAVKREQQEAIDRVTAAVVAAQELLAGESLESGKRKAGLSAGDKPSKRARIYGFEDFSESDSSDDSEDEAAARLQKAGQVATTRSSGNDSDESAQEVAIAEAGPDVSPLNVQVPAQASATAESSRLHTAANSKAAPQSGKQSGRSLFRSPAVTDADTPAAAAAAETAKVESSSLAGSTVVLPAAAIADAEQASSNQKHVETPAADATPVSLADYSSPAELEAVGMVRLKSELVKHGLKCGGSLSERAARLFLLKETAVSKLDRKHFSKPNKQK